MFSASYGDPHPAPRGFASINGVAGNLKMSSKSRVSSGAADEPLGGLSIAVQFRDLGQAAHKLLNDRLSAVDLSLDEFLALESVAVRPGVTAAELSASIVIEAPAFSRLIQSLVKKRLLTRRRSRIDRRRVHLSANAAGLERVERASQIAAEAEQEFLQPLNAAELRLLKRALKHLLRAQC
ncbi:MAG: winged helix-turn-helix transcriptional regulator [Chloroflexi bacterium]|nr:winged helix-turn-helix transcriptional regulator [Chloroflexota bacterium]